MHRLGRTGRLGKQGAGLQVLLPIESYFRSKLEKQGVRKRRVVDISFPNKQDEKKIALCKGLVQSGHANLSFKAQAAYLSLVAYFVQYADMRVSGSEILDTCLGFAKSVGLKELPSLPENVVSQLSERRRRE